MSTTEDLDVAIRYAINGEDGASLGLIMKVRTSSFLERGADIQFISAFPGEKEFLYPPLTFLKPTNPNKEPVEVMIKGSPFRVVEVEPKFAS